MRIICLSPRMENYPWAFYQQDTLAELARQHEVFFYGPGFAAYDTNDGWKELFAKCPIREPELILLAHWWLRDRPGEPIDRHPKLRPSESGLPVVLILNKEYANLEEKLRYIRTNQINLILTHHHDADKYQQETGCRCSFWPFAVDMRKFPDQPAVKRYDMTFTGTLRNKVWPESQSDIRLRIQRRLFHCFLDSPILLRRRFRKWNVFWISQSRYPWINRIKKGWHLGANSYLRLLTESRAVINCLSPVQLVGSRYFESMAARALVLCEESERYDGLFSPADHCVTFKADLSDLIEIVEFYLSNEGTRSAITQRAYEHVRTFHTWERRIQELTALVADL
ncbi:glycosyltransferase [Candidatus Methylomirabilis sp.]|uniref:glycosyltransferase family protein n=1 Tax=Candidatus Methylomirabilis sp. TaxID=2032687 RepID=UPI0030761AA3